MSTTVRKTGIRFCARRNLGRMVALLTAAILGVSSIAGCNGKSEANSAVEKKYTEGTKNTENIHNTVSEGGDYTDNSAKRIVSGYYITTSLLIALGLEERTVGIEAKADQRPIYQLAAPDFLNLPSVGTAKEFDLEGCASLSPDLVILPKKLSEQAEILEGMGIHTLVVNPESMQELEDTIRSISEATGMQDKAEKLLSYYNDKKDKLSRLNIESKGEAVRVYIGGTSSILRTVSTQMYQNSLIESAGGVNAMEVTGGQGWLDISYEDLLSCDPDIIVIIPEADYTREDIMQDEQLENLKAVREGAVYEMPSAFEAWDSPVPSGILGCLWLSSIIHDLQYPLEDMRKDAAEFYKEFYGIEIDRELINR